MAFHHGARVKRVNGGSVPIDQANSAIIGIVGTAPMGPVNTLTLCQTKKDFAQFGTILDKGYTLPDAFDIIARYQAGQVYVVNVLDPTRHKTTVTNETLTIDPTTLIANTANAGLLEATIADKTAGEDYDINLMRGEITFKVPPADDEDIQITYTFADPSKVTDDDIRGGFDVDTQKRTGLELIKQGFNLFATDAKILLCPHFAEKAGVAASLQTLANQIKAIAYIDAPQGTTLSQALSGRGPKGTINFKTSENRAHLFYPFVTGNRGTPESLATHAAGLRMYVDTAQGYWFSTSNHTLRGVIGTEVVLTSRLDDEQSETNLLNAVGITTVFNSFGTGFRLWGNRTAAYPTMTHISNFEVALRTGDVIDESIVKASLQFVDLPIDNALLDALLESIATFMRTLRSIVGFNVMLDPDADLVDAFSKGTVPIVYDYTPKLPAELIDYTSVMTRKYLINLVAK